MQTPAGRECRHFFGDYFRGRHVERCRLLEAAGQTWEPRLCETCPVPDILQANACEHQQLSPKVNKPLFFLRPEVQVSAYCHKCECPVAEPAIGCGQCVSLPIEWVLGPGD
ncbi:MAG: hypothetical protein KIT46_01615 [Anaerolineales bacterium]|nr:hypothetical protein [Anaerolineales bacterium]MCW5854722.1 hypothetical protein [Anaerolineales bacterium]